MTCPFALRSWPTLRARNMAYELASIRLDAAPRMSFDTLDVTNAKPRPGIRVHSRSDALMAQSIMSGFKRVD